MAEPATPPAPCPCTGVSTSVFYPVLVALIVVLLGLAYTFSQSFCAVARRRRLERVAGRALQSRIRDAASPGLAGSKIRDVGGGKRRASAKKPVETAEENAWGISYKELQVREGGGRRERREGGRGGSGAGERGGGGESVLGGEGETGDECREDGRGGGRERMG